MNSVFLGINTQIAFKLYLVVDSYFYTSDNVTFVYLNVHTDEFDVCLVYLYNKYIKVTQYFL